MSRVNEDGFVRRVANGVPFFTCRALDDLPGLRHGFSTRHGGGSKLPACALNLSYVPWDSGGCVAENRRRFLAALGIESVPLLTLRQTHSDRIHIIREMPDRWNPHEGDALVSSVKGVALGVQTADCLPILIADPETGIVAAVHSGWKGTLARIALKTVRVMRDTFGCRPAGLLAAVGPAIRACCYEVGAELADLFREAYPGVRLAVERAQRQGKFLLDLPAALRVQFEEAGVLPGNVHDMRACTRCGVGEFFSYRGEGKHSGRMMAVIARTGP